MRKFSFALAAVTFAAAVTWGVIIASIWLPVDARVMPLVRVTAAVSAVALMFLGSARWLACRGIAYLLDLMVTQRAASRTRRPAPTVPFPQVVRREAR